MRNRNHFLHPSVSHHAAQGAFTLIELITVVSITALISVVSVSVLVNTQIRGTRSTTLNKVRQEGTFVLDQLTFLLRNARYLEENQFGETCATNMSAIRMRTQEGVPVEIYLTEDNRVASDSGTISNPPAVYLTSDGVEVTSLSFNCQQQQSEGGAIVRVNFTLATGNPDTVTPEAYFSQDFFTQVYVRSYQ